MSVGVAGGGVKGSHVVVGAVRLRIGGDVHSGLRGGVDGGKGGDGQGGDKDGLNRWE